MESRDDELVITLRIWSEKKRLSPAARSLMKEAAEVLQKCVPVVRCKECKHWYSDADVGMACEFTNLGQPRDGFCNWGEEET